jgi:hypothetical protein
MSESNAHPADAGVANSGVLVSSAAPASGSASDGTEDPEIAELSIE